MDLRIKTLLVIGIAQVCLIPILFLTLHDILMVLLTRLKERDAFQYIGRLKDAIHAGLSNLKQKLTD